MNAQTAPATGLAAQANAAAKAATKAKPAPKADKKPAPAKKAEAKATKPAPKKDAKPKAEKKPRPEGSRSTDALREKAPGYVHDKEHKTTSGNASVHCGDEVAKKLLGRSLDECYAIAAKVCECTEKDLREKYKHLNVGMQRMNLGNKMRGILMAK